MYTITIQKSLFLFHALLFSFSDIDQTLLPTARIYFILPRLLSNRNFFNLLLHI
ncbi:hypothetical protein HMPREF9151_01083 [Hoylesella saccharolytica F0055]|uniref:Uncharacterized protein n=1 Tax=Hoylesella saccharolytica F0055 TaxID=1127699 RepID=L1ND64_9BACT|nr:hypothetical protein HMPREF9151_01083 [Hoylesella saccharolytica F0055]